MKRLNLKLFVALALLSFTVFSTHADIFQVDGVYYEDTGYYSDNGLPEVKVTCEGGELLSFYLTSYEGDVVVPETVEYEGVTYVVTSVMGFCSSGWQGWTCAGAFYNCSELTSVVLPSTIRDIYGFAFSRCIGLTSFTCLATTPPTTHRLQDNQFYEYGQFFSDFAGHATLYVPKGSVEAYQNAEEWSDFSNIIGIGGEDILKGDVDDDGIIGIADITALIDYMLNDLNDVNHDNADVDEDGIIGIGDITALIDMILS